MAYEFSGSRLISFEISTGGEFEVNAEGQIGLFGTDVSLGTAVAANVGVAYGTQQTIAKTLKVAAAPGTFMQYTISHRVTTKVGTASIDVNGQTQKVPFRFPRDFRLEVVDVKQLPCPGATGAAVEPAPQEVIANVAATNPAEAQVDMSTQVPTEAPTGMPTALSNTEVQTKLPAATLITTSTPELEIPISTSMFTPTPPSATPTAIPLPKTVTSQTEQVQTTPAAVPTTSTANTVTSIDTWWRNAAANVGCSGTAIYGITDNAPPSVYAAEVLAPRFEGLSGIKVQLAATDSDDMYARAIGDLQANSGIYDFVYIEQDLFYRYLTEHYLVDITEQLADNPDLAAPDFSFDKFTSWLDNFKDESGDVFGIPMEAFIKIYLYRKDLFSDPKIRAAFKAKYGYDLAPATTHQQYQDIADFFTWYGQDNGLSLWGSTVQGNTGHASSFYEFFETIAPSFGVYNWGINMDNWKADVANGGGMNSDKAKEALAFWVGLLKDAPPEATASTWDEVAASFAAGRAAQGWVYGENAAWIATNPAKSKVVGSVGVALPPVSEGVMDDARSGNGYIGYYDGGAFGMPVSSKNQKCTLLWLQYIGQESVQPDWAIAGSRIVMNSTYDDPKVKEVDAKTDGYFTLMKEQGPLFKGAPPFPFHAALREVVQPFIWKALAGEMTPADALDQAALAANDVLAAQASQSH